MVGAGRPGTHLFKLYLKDYGEPVLPFVRFVRVFLHPAYRPDDVVDLCEQPFFLERPAWGEFPIRIQLHFKDAQRNKPVDLYHQLGIFAATDAKYLECGQSLHEIDMDKRSDSVDVAAVEDDAIYISESEDSSADELFDLNSTTAASPLHFPEVINPHYLKYCKYCGLPHHPQTSFGILQKNCAMKPRKIRVSSRSVPWNLFTASEEFEGKKSPSSHGGLIDLSNSIIQPGDPDQPSPIDEDASGEEKLIAAVASQLDLPCLHVPTEDTTAVLLSATQVFLKRLLAVAIRNIPSQAQRAILDQNLPVVLTPVHLYNAVLAIDEYDFLSNAHFSASTSNTGASANNTK
jgi:hypothetical protein